nr:DUF4352 domain-containing protein [Tsuneonella aeria]
MRNLHTAILASAILLTGCDSADDTIAPTETAAAPDKIYKLGETASAGGLEFAITKVEERSQIGPVGIGPKAGSGEVFVVVRYTIKNIGKEPIDRWDFPKVELINGEEVTLAKDTEATALEGALKSDSHGTGDLNPKVTATETSVWKVEKASFDRDTWQLKASFDSAVAAAVTWPMEPNVEAPILFSLK